MLLVIVPVVALSECSASEPFHMLAQLKDNKDPAMRTSEPIKSVYSLQPKESYVSQIKLRRFSFSLHQLSFFKKFNDQHTFLS